MNVPCKRMHLLDLDPDNDPDSYPDRNPNNFVLCKRGINFNFVLMITGGYMSMPSAGSPSNPGPYQGYPRMAGYPPTSGPAYPSSTPAYGQASTAAYPGTGPAAYPRAAAAAGYQAPGYPPRAAYPQQGYQGYPGYPQQQQQPAPQQQQGKPSAHATIFCCCKGLRE